MINNFFQSLPTVPSFAMFTVLTCNLAFCSNNYKLAQGYIDNVACIFSLLCTVRYHLIWRVFRCTTHNVNVRPRLKWSLFPVYRPIHKTSSKNLLCVYDTFFNFAVFKNYFLCITQYEFIKSNMFRSHRLPPLHLVGKAIILLRPF